MLCSHSGTWSPGLGKHALLQMMVKSTCSTWQGPGVKHTVNKRQNTLYKKTKPQPPHTSLLVAIILGFGLLLESCMSHPYPLPQSGIGLLRPETDWNQSHPLEMHCSSGGKCCGEIPDSNQYQYQYCRD